MNTHTPYGFRIVGPCTGERRCVDWYAAFTAYAGCDARAGVEREAYLSAFTFGDAFREHLTRTGSTKGYGGPCGASWLWFDIDRDAASGGIEAARRDAGTLTVNLTDRFALAEDALLVFYSGSKGFHVGLPTAGFNPEPGLLFHRIARRFCESFAASVGVVIDAGVYDAVRAFRAPNSRHPKTERHKRQLTVNELLHMDAPAILKLAEAPAAFEVPTDAGCGLELPAAWNTAAEQVRQESEAVAHRRAAVVAGVESGRLNRLTLDFIRQGADTGDRHRLLFSAAANLAECGAPLGLCRELLTEAALDSGLPPAEVERQVRCGVEHARAGGPTP